MSHTKVNLINTINELKVETMNFKEPVTEHKRQLKKKLDFWCRHHKTEEVEVLVPGLDQTLTIKHCKECGKAL